MKGLEMSLGMLRLWGLGVWASDVLDFGIRKHSLHSSYRASPHKDGKQGYNGDGISEFLDSALNPVQPYTSPKWLPWEEIHVKSDYLPKSS